MVDLVFILKNPGLAFFNEQVDFGQVEFGQVEFDHVELDHVEFG